MHINYRHEKSLVAWVWRLCLGPAYVVDGCVAFFSLGYVSSGCAVFVARHMAKARANNFIRIRKLDKKSG